MSRGKVRAAICAVVVAGAWLIGGPLTATLAVGLCLLAVVLTPGGRSAVMAMSTRGNFLYRRWRGRTRGTVAELREGLTRRIEPSGALRWGTRWAVVFDAQDTEDALWLQVLLDEPQLVAVSITQQTGPATVASLALASTAPDTARQVLLEACTPACDLPDRWVTLLWQQSPQWIPATGRPLRAQQIAHLVDTALVGTGPTQDMWSRFAHAGACSQVWQTTGQPADPAPLLIAQDAVPVKRVTRVYRRQPRTGVLEQSVVVTATCPAGPDGSAGVARAVRAAAARAGTGLAPALGAMPQGFLVGLGLGALPESSSR